MVDREEFPPGSPPRLRQGSSRLTNCSAVSRKPVRARRKKRKNVPHWVLSSLNTAELRRRAADAGVPPGQLEDAENTNGYNGAVINLIMASDGSAPPADSSRGSEMMGQNYRPATARSTCTCNPGRSNSITQDHPYKNYHRASFYIEKWYKRFTENSGSPSDGWC